MSPIRRGPSCAMCTQRTSENNLFHKTWTLQAVISVFQIYSLPRCLAHDCSACHASACLHLAPCFVNRIVPAKFQNANIIKHSY